MAKGPKKTGDEGSALGSINDILTRLKEIVNSNISPTAMIDTVVEVDRGAHEVIKTFGQGREMILGLKATMTGAVDAVKLLGGDFVKIQQMQVDVATTLNRNLVLSKDSYEGLYATTEITGIRADSMVSSFKDAGFSAYDAASKMGEVVNIAREVGVSAKDVSSKVVNNMDVLNKYNFEGGVQGLAKMAAQASMLRIDMGRTLEFVNKVYNPEGAIETAAALQRLGVAQSDLLDPLRLMDLSQNDPTELQNQIVKMTQQFVKLNDAGNFEIMKGSKRQFQEIALAMNIPYETLTKMALGSAELDDKMRKIRFPDLNLTEEQKTMIANMSEMKDGTYKIEVGGESKSISQLSKEDVELLKKVGEPKTMEELAKDQLDTLKDIDANTKYFEGKLPYTFAGSKVSQGVLEGTRKVSRGITKTVPKELSITELRKSLDSATTEVASIIKGMGTNTMSVSEGIVKLSNVLSDGGTFIETTWKKWADNFEKSLDSEGINLESVKKLYKNMTDGVTVPKNAGPNPVFSPSQNQNSTNITPVNTSTNNQTSTTGTNSSAIDVNLNHTVTINAPAGIDTQQLVLALKNEEIKQSILLSVKDGVTNSGRLTSNSNPQQSMNYLRNSFGVLG